MLITLGPRYHQDEEIEKLERLLIAAISSLDPEGRHLLPNFLDEEGG